MNKKIRVFLGFAASFFLAATGIVNFSHGNTLLVVIDTIGALLLFAGTVGTLRSR